MEAVDLEHMLFCVASKSTSAIRYNVSSSTHFCDCPSHVSTCKHMLDVQQIVKDFFISSQSREASIGYVPRL